MFLRADIDVETEPSNPRSFSSPVFPTLFISTVPKFRILDDGWTVQSTIPVLSAQHEETVLITDVGVEILTQVAFDTLPTKAAL